MNGEWHKILERAGAAAKQNAETGLNGGDHEAKIFITDLSWLDLLDIEGNDALEFLNGQFTGDLKQLPAGAFHYNAWCNPQGRVIAVFIIYRREQSFSLLIPAEIKNHFLNRLQLYILRADVTIHDRSDELVRLGLIAGRNAAQLPTVPESAGTLRHEGGITVLRIEDGPPLRMLVLGTVAEMQSLKQEFAGAGTGLWQYLDIKAGIPWVLDSTCEKFLPQELNLDVTGGLSYEKGCFPGQEVIARVHYRGAVKQRLYRSEIPADARLPAPGEKLYVPDTENSIGTIINIANSGHGDVAVLAVAEIDEAENNDLHVAGKHGMVLRFEAVDW